MTWFWRAWKTGTVPPPGASVHVSMNDYLIHRLEVRSPTHLKVMRDFRHGGDLHTNAWTAERFDRSLVWQQAEDRLLGRSLAYPTTDRRQARSERQRTEETAVATIPS